LFQYLKGAHQKAGEGLFTRAGSDKASGNGFKLKDNSSKSLDIRKKLFPMRAVRVAAYKSCCHPLLGSVQCQVGWGFEQPGL